MFNYTNQGQTEQIGNYNDSDVLKETLEAFRLLGLPSWFNLDGF